MDHAGRLMNAAVAGVATGGVATTEPHVLEQLVVNAAGAGGDGLIAGGSDASATPGAGHRVDDAQDCLPRSDPRQIGQNLLGEVGEAQLPGRGELDPCVFEAAKTLDRLQIIKSGYEELQQAEGSLSLIHI